MAKSFKKDSISSDDSARLRMLELLVDKLTDKVTDLLVINKEHEKKINEVIQAMNNGQGSDEWDTPVENEKMGDDINNMTEV